MASALRMNACSVGCEIRTGEEVQEKFREIGAEIPAS
jgi:hypothetical protein